MRFPSPVGIKNASMRHVAMIATALGGMIRPTMSSTNGTMGSK